MVGAMSSSNSVRFLKILIKITTSNMEQTIGRAGGYKGNKGEEATLAMIEMLYLLDQI
jgi:6,7-dimethyl-8-ribityllumazine synthase